MRRPPVTYPEWVRFLQEFQTKPRDKELLYLMQNGKIAWQNGVAERFLNRVLVALMGRIKTAQDAFKIKRTGGEHALMEEIRQLKEEYGYCYRACDIASLPVEARKYLSKAIKDAAHKNQMHLEQDARRDRTGKLASLVRRNPVDPWAGEY